MTKFISSAQTKSVSSVWYPIIFVMILAIDIYILVETLKMEKYDYQCKCAQVWHLKQVSNSVITVISLQLGIFVFSLISSLMNHNRVLSVFIKILSIALFIAQLYYIIMMLSLIGKLDKIKCLCVDPQFKTVMTYYAGIRAFVIIATILFLITFVILNRK